ncbi:hydroquinone glucosyltransferase-like [Senna tora]|uniref:Glycosyltransferase n=1 Tax=Senna tora TaxID=362788 RepID=A0A835CJQ4_9FABA|nr:hydroquinone glucosyltransferase-like [Senna tora]
MESKSKTHIALVSIPAFSHQASILEFAKRLLHLHPHHFHVTCLIPTLPHHSPPPASLPFLHSLPPSIHPLFLPPPNLDDVVPPHNTPLLQVHLQLALSRSMPSVRRALASLSGLSALVVDPFASEALEFAKELNAASYIYFPSSAMLLKLCLYAARLDTNVSGDCEFRDVSGFIEIPGCVPLRGIDLPDNLQERSGVAYRQFLQRCKRYRLAEGFFVNTFVEMERDVIGTLTGEDADLEDQEDEGATNVYPVGPIIQSGSNPQQSGSDCLRWLDTQPPNSVLYVSFGSGGSLSGDQIKELALGLELSNSRFLWVNVKPPSDKASASYLSTNENESPEAFLPKGFVERTKERGMVMSCWAPQVEVLGHSATGGFLSHCGWNSVLESVVKGVPLIAWPLFAEQRTNAAMLVDGLKVAVRAPEVGDGVMEKEEIAKVIKSLMEGEEGKEVRRRMKKLKDDAVAAVTEDGSSTRTLSELAMKWKRMRDAI